MTIVRAKVAGWYRGIEFQIAQRNAKGEFDVVVGFEKKPHDPTVGEPSFFMEYDKAQDLFDDLWRAGLRPSDGTGSVGELKATQNHLKDLQEIVKKTLDKMLGDEK